MSFCARPNFNAGPLVVMTDHIVSDQHTVLSGTASATAGVSVRADGVLEGFCLRNPDVTYPGEWLVAGGIPSQYEVRFTQLSGTALSGAALNTWNPLNTSQSVSISASRATLGTLSNSAIAFVEVRRIGETEVLDSCSFILNAEASRDA